MKTTTSTISKFAKWKQDQIDQGFILQEPSETLLATWYAEQVVAGHIVASKKNILSAKRHLNDLKRQGTDGFPWIFIEEKGHRPIRFVEKFCRPSKSGVHEELVKGNLVFQPWQHFTLGSLYGWVHKDTGIRRFREGLIFVARKNGKSGKASGLSAYAASKDNERGADVYVLANSMKQVKKTIYDECKKMIRASPKLRRNFRVTRDAIFYDKTNSTIEPQASDSELLDGLNTHLGIFDEIHEYKDYKLINIIKKSRGSRKQPLILYITTAGYQLDGPLVKYYEDAEQVLEGAIEDERTFYYIAELDDEKEFDQPEKWIKANPNMGVTLDLDTLVVDWEKDKRIPEERTDFITKQFNFFVNSDQMAFLDYNVLKSNNKHLDIADLEGAPCIGGFDLSESDDFTSACLEFPLSTGEVFILSHSWVPKLKILDNHEKLPYEELKRAGHLTIVDDSYINLELVYDWFVKQSKKYQIEKIAYDKAKAFRLVKELNAAGFDTEIVRQGAFTLTPTMRDLKDMFRDRKVIFNEDRLLRWYINNVKLKKNENGSWLPQKINRYRKIDGFAALLNAHTHCMELLVEPTGNGEIGVMSMSDLRG
ncbi:terminase large subunit [Bacillus sp. A301a_S52]|nr:terminase large subunit [Bacillus sp. A301a_S52]